MTLGLGTCWAGTCLGHNARMEEPCPKGTGPHVWTPVKSCRCGSCGDWHCIPCGDEAYKEYCDESTSPETD